MHYYADMMTKAKSKPLPAITVRLTDEDFRLVQALQQKKGILSLSDLVRACLRDSAQKEGVSA